MGKLSDTPKSPALATEKRTIAAMVAIYCEGTHRPDAVPCAECQELLDYALRRLDCCPFGEEKTACAQCPIHCYKPAMRERVRAVMRYAGPRMVLRHPLLALRHQWNSRERRSGPENPPGIDPRQGPSDPQHR